MIYVAPESPAAKAGIQKHDVLVELGDQMLVAPTQLRKLIQMQKENDTLKFDSSTRRKKANPARHSGQADQRCGNVAGGRISRTGAKVSQFAFVDGKGGAQVDEHLKTLYGTLAHGGTDKQRSNSEVQRDMEELRQAIQQALRESNHAMRATQPASPAMPATPAPANEGGS